MSNYYNSSRKLHFSQLELEPVVRDLEHEFKSKGADSLGSMEEALTWYDMLLNNAGEIAGEFIAPRAEAVDEKGCKLEDGTVSWAQETQENMDMLAQSGYMGAMLERRFGGLAMPVSVNNIIVEMISQADASLMNLYGLQDIAVTLQKFGTEEQKQRVLPKFAKGEVSGAMALTEPDAGSDLQAVSLKAIEKDGKWYLDGVKRFITNGSGDVLLVLARSEAGTTSGRGLSMFLCEKSPEIVVRRIENKLGIHGSPTCELQFNMAPAELVGKRKFGLIKYVMSLMNGARLAVSAQALGIAQAAFEEAVEYANEREQFGKRIVEIPAVYQMLKSMQAEIETSRALLYQTGLAVDMMEIYERKAKAGEKVKTELRAATALADFLTPLSKFTISELANRAAYDSLQIHGGVGYMKDFKVERLLRDARITNIYEGTTQLQVVAAIGALVKGLFEKEMEEVRSMELTSLKKEQKEVISLLDKTLSAIASVHEMESLEFHDYTATYLVEMASILYRLKLYLPIAEQNPDKRNILKFFLMESDARIRYLENRIFHLKEQYGENIDRLKDDFLK
ncbi:MAG: acyl-CoA dehydrogenase [Acidobacteria bacterium]|nr:MAG: acyl-CoA dehydrogenase [Acidobacteriota bacterium]RLE24643.1 MAG: acyl-CoA dehydrogenase [Acidobacteriota bacterium]